MFEHEGESRPGLLCMLPQTTEVLWFRWAGADSWIVDFESQQPEVRPGVPSNANVTAVAPGPLGQRIVTVDVLGQVTLYERSATTWTKVGERDIGASAQMIAVAPDGEQIPVGAADGRILAFDRNLGVDAASFGGHRQQVTFVRYSSDGALVASSSDDGTLRVWQRDGTPVAGMSTGTGAVTSCEFSPDGRRLVTAHITEGVARTWLLDTRELVAAAKVRVSRGLTDDERRRYAELLRR